MIEAKIQRLLIAALWLQVVLFIILFQFVGARSLNPSAIYGQF